MHEHSHGHDEYDHKHNLDHHHCADHTAGHAPEDDIQKLKTVLLYLVKHNKDHITDLKKWAGAAVSAQFQNVASELEEASRLSGEVTAHIEKALLLLSKTGAV